MSDRKYPDDRLFRFHFLDGSKNEGYGRDAEDAFGRMGFGAGAVRALDYYEAVEAAPANPAVERLARRLAARTMGLSNDGENLPDELWKQKEEEARIALDLAREEAGRTA